MIISGVGRLGQNPKMQYNPAGTAITNFPVAVNCGYGDNKETVWVSLVAFGAQGEAVKKYFEKGHRIEFSAEIQKNRGYEKKDGTVGVSLDARLLTFNFVDKNEVSGAEEPDEF